MASIEMVRNLLESLILNTPGSKDSQLRFAILNFLKLTLQTMQIHSNAFIAGGSKLHGERHLLDFLVSLGFNVSIVSDLFPHHTSQRFSLILRHPETSNHIPKYVPKLICFFSITETTLAQTLSIMAPLPEEKKEKKPPSALALMGTVNLV
jgi:hypothetical protein